MGKTLRDLVREYERDLVLRTLARNGQDRERARLALGLSPRGFAKVLERHHISAKRYTRRLPIPPVSRK
jgi:DNA-binding NtrC family response regulator